MLNCTFAGHREVLESVINLRLMAVLERLLQNESEATFYTGGMGEYDLMCASAVRQLKRRFPEKQIQLFLVCPYMTMGINRDGEYLKAQYDDVLIPAELMDCHYKNAITKRNRWMIDQCGTIITYVKRDYGGAFTAKKYAERKGLDIIELFGSGEP